MTGGRLNVANALTGFVSEPLPEPEPLDATITLSKRRLRNTTEVTVRWDGLVGPSVTVGNGFAAVSTTNDREFVQTWTGSGTVTYTVCETDGAPCVTASIGI